MLCQVTAPLEFGHDAQHRQQEAQLGRDRCLQEELALDDRLQVVVERVDEAVALLDHEGVVTIAGQQRIGCRREALSDEREQLDDLGVDLLELLMERLAQRFDEHQRNPLAHQ